MRLELKLGVCDTWSFFSLEAGKARAFNGGGSRFPVLGLCQEAKLNRSREVLTNFDRFTDNKRDLN